MLESNGYKICSLKVFFCTKKGLLDFSDRYVERKFTILSFCSNYKKLITEAIKHIFFGYFQTPKIPKIILKKAEPGIKNYKAVNQQIATIFI